MKFNKNFNYIMAWHSQAIGFLIMAWFSGEYLNNNYQKSFNWLNVTFCIALIGVIHFSYIIIKKIMLDNKKSKNK